MIIRKRRAELREYIVSTLTLLTCNYTDFITGLFLTIFGNIIKTARYIMLILPAIMNMRGCNYVTYSTRVSAKLHLGVIEPKFRKQKELSLEVLIAYAITIIAGIIITALAVMICSKCINFTDNILVIAVLSGIISATATIPATTFLLFQLFKRNIRPEVVVGPLESIIGDVITVPTVVLAYLVARLICGKTLLYIPFLTALSISITVLIYRICREKSSLWNPKRILTETIIAATVSSTIEIFTGLFILKRLTTYLTISVLLFALPATMAAAGAVNVKYSAELSTMLHLGEIEPTARICKKSLEKMLRSLSQALILYTNVFLIALVYSLSTHILNASALLIPPCAGLIATLIMLIVNYYIVIISFRLGINPANVAGPLIMPLCDLASSILYMTLSGIFLR